MALARLAYKAAGSASWQRVIRETAQASANRVFPNLDVYKDQAATFARSSWVYLAVNRVATDSAIVTLNIVEYQDEKRVVIPNHALNQLLRQPNGWQSGFEFAYATFLSLLLTGNAYWFLNGAA